MAGQKFNPDGSAHGQGSWFAIADSKNRGSKNKGGSWFNIGSPDQKVTGRNPVHALTAEGVKVASTDGGRRTDPGKGASFTSRDCGAEGRKGYVPVGTKALGKHGHPRILPQIVNKTGSGSKARKAASAQIAKIPLALSSHIARVYKPKAEAA